jgi:hypothetical protein
MVCVSRDSAAGEASLKPRRDRGRASSQSWQLKASVDGPATTIAQPPRRGDRSSSRQSLFNHIDENEPAANVDIEMSCLRAFFLQVKHGSGPGTIREADQSA